VDRLHLISGEPFRGRRPVLAKLRYAQPAAPATIHPMPEGRARLSFDEPQRAVAPGQAAVCYDASDPDLVLGGGTIRRRL
jgi:tRNA-specific 2-thiouridylase